MTVRSITHTPGDNKMINILLNQVKSKLLFWPGDHHGSEKNNSPFRLNISMKCQMIFDIHFITNRKNALALENTDG